MSELYANQILKNETNIPARFIEGPCMESLTPDLVGKRVLSIACGAGAECQKFADSGASKVLGIDQVPEVIDIAKERFPDVDFQVMDMQQLDFPDGSFDFAYSSKSMHYIKDWRTVLKPLHRILTAGSQFLLSTHHPMLWAAEQQKNPDSQSRLLGYQFNPNEEGLQLFGNYLQPSKRQEDTSDLTLDFYHKPFAEIFTEIKESGFSIDKLEEPAMHDSGKEQYPRPHKMFSAFPLFLVLRLTRE